jgi:hypothetical protein
MKTSCHGPQKRATQVTLYFSSGIERGFTWVAHSPVGHDKLWI